MSRKNICNNKYVQFEREKNNTKNKYTSITTVLTKDLPKHFRNTKRYTTKPLESKVMANNKWPLKVISS